MKQLGVIYHLNTVLPDFALFSRAKENDAFAQIRSHLEEKGFHSFETDLEDNPMRYIDQVEDHFLLKFGKLAEDKLFFRNLIWLRKHMPEIRLKVRNDFLYKIDVAESITGLQIICESNKKASKIFTSYIRSIRNWEDHTLFSLEKELDKQYIRMLKESAGRLNNAYKRYVEILESRYTKDSKNRQRYLLAEEGNGAAEPASDSSFQDLAHEECRFVNDARYVFDPDLIMLQCYVRYKFLFYDLRLFISIPEEERSQELVNYTIHA